MSRDNKVEELERDFKTLHARCRASEDEADALRARCERLEKVIQTATQDGGLDGVDYKWRLLYGCFDERKSVLDLLEGGLK